MKEEHIFDLKKQLGAVIEYWAKDTLLDDKLVSMYYIGIIAKSNRIHCLLNAPGKKSNESIVGAKFSEAENGKRKHIMTHCVSVEILQKTVTVLDLCISILHTQFDGEISHDQIKNINENAITLESSKLAKTIFVSVLVDAYYVERIGVELETQDFTEYALITIYNTARYNSLFRKLNIDFSTIRKIDETTLLLRPGSICTTKK